MFHALVFPLFSTSKLASRRSFVSSFLCIVLKTSACRTIHSSRRGRSSPTGALRHSDGTREEPLPQAGPRAPQIPSSRRLPRVGVACDRRRSGQWRAPLRLALRHGRARHRRQCAQHRATFRLSPTCETVGVCRARRYLREAKPR